MLSINYRKGMAVKTAFLMMVLTIAFLSRIGQASPLETMSYQGRLTASSGTPVADGFYAFNFSLWTDSMPGIGSQVWSENQDLSVKSGLFTAQLGRISSFFDIFTELAAIGTTLYLETKVMVGGGQQTLSPRMRLGSVPLAKSSGGVHGDVFTGLGTLVMYNLDSTSRIEMGASTEAGKKVAKFKAGADLAGSVNKRTVAITASEDEGSIAIDEQGVHRAFMFTNDDTSHLALKTYQPGQPTYGNMSFDATGDGARRIASFFDVFTEVSLDENINAGGALSRWKSGMSGSTTGLIRMQATSDSAVSTLESDVDGDGHSDFGVASSCDNTVAQEVVYKKGLNAVNVKRAITSRADDLEAVHMVDADSDDDGLMDRSISSSCDATGAKHAINTKGTGGTRVASVTSSTSELAASSACSLDLDGDGIPERGIDDDCNGVSSSRSMSFFDVFTELSITDSIDATGARRRLSTGNIGSSGNDGVEIVARPDGSSSVRCDNDSDDDGVADNEASLHVTPQASSMAIKTKGTGAAHNRISSTTYLDSVVQSADMSDGSSSSSNNTRIRLNELENKLINIGLLRTTSSTRACDATSSSASCAIDNNNDGVVDNDVSLHVTPTSSSVAIKRKGTGAANNRTISSSCDDASAVHYLDADDDGDGLSDRQVTSSVDSDSAQVMAEGSGIQVAMKVKNKGVVNGSIIVVNANRAVVDLDSDGDGYLDHSLGIGVDGTHRIDVAGGAYCDGTNWVNASDKNAKENFAAVDGSELLAMIDELPITRWNYKNDNPSVAHIGPTAQDFHSIFGVGNDSISISTIDPSGIALAAIKELSKRANELEQKSNRVTELELELKELKAMVAELLANRK
jgi:hypothetical protein